LIPSGPGIDGGIIKTPALGNSPSEFSSPGLV
jgi:hypothetical protein